MLEIVAKGFRNAKEALSGKATLTEANIRDAVRQIRVSLLEADVEIGVTRAFIDRVKKRAIGEVVNVQTDKGAKKLSVSPGEHFILICQDELEKLMGPVEETPIVYHRPYTTIMLVGLQGTGKTTTAGKLARYFSANKRKPMLVAADIYRPAAVDQLKVLGEQISVPVFAQDGLAPPQLCQDALREAKRRKKDIVIFDTAGRLAIDDKLMTELEEIKARTRPDYTILVCDAMAGQDTVHTASEFNRRLDISGFIMTKLDGDARGGAALSIKEITGKPIKFLGMGEGMEKLEPFRPEGLASRILGMGDVVGLMRDFEDVVDEREAERDTKKLLKGKFTLDDFLKQLHSLKQVGSLSEIYEKMPLFGDAGLPEGVSIDDQTFVVMESMIQSMTPEERATPKIIDKSRAKRIARGAGRKPEQVTDLLQRFDMMQGMMQSLVAQPGLLGNIPGFKQLGQLRKLKGLKNSNPADLFGGDMLKGLGPGALPTPGGGPASMPPRMQMPPGIQMPSEMQIPPGVSQEQYAEMVQEQMAAYGLGAGGGAARGRTQKSSADKKKAQKKRKQAKKSRKKSRRK